MSGLQAHLEGGATTLCRAWAVARRDGVRLGFTDHDLDLRFDGLNFQAATGLTARALSQTTGLSVDNTEAVGILSSAGVTEGDLRAGRYDGAEVWCWLVNWADVAARRLLFRGTIGEVTQGGGAFRAELRGQAEVLNRSLGRVFQPTCGASFGDADCGIDRMAHAVEAAVLGVTEARILTLDAGTAAAGWYGAGRIELLDGAGAGLDGRIRQDRTEGALRRIELWQDLPILPAPGDRLRMTAGCDRTAATCRTKFGNLLNFQGFPHIPGDDWLASYPLRDGQNDGRSLRRQG